MQCNQLLGNKVIATYSDYCKRTRRESLNRSIESKPNVLLTVQGSSESNYLGFKCAKDVWFQSSVNHPAAQVSIHTSEVSLGHWMQKNLMRRRTLITFSEIPLSIMTSPHLSQRKREGGRDRAMEVKEGGMQQTINCVAGRRGRKSERETEKQRTGERE